MHGVRVLTGIFCALILIASGHAADVATAQEDDFEAIAAKAMAEIRKNPLQPIREISRRNRYEDFLPEAPLVVSPQVAGLFDQAIFYRGFATSSANRPTIKWNRMPVTLPGHTARHLYDGFSIAAIPNDTPESRDRVELLYSGTKDINALVVAKPFDPNLNVQGRLRLAQGPYDQSQDLNREHVLASWDVKVDRASDLKLNLFGSRTYGRDPNFIPSRAKTDAFAFSDDSSQLWSKNAALSAAYQKKFAAFEVGLSGYGGYHDFFSANKTATSLEEKRTLYGASVAGSFIEEGRETTLKTTFTASADLQQGRGHPSVVLTRDAILDSDFSYRTLAFRLDQQIQWISWVRTEAGVALESFQVTAPGLKKDGISVIPAIGITLNFDRTFDLRLTSSIENSLNDYRAMDADSSPFTRVMRYEGRIGTRLSRRVRSEMAVYGTSWEPEPIFDTLQAKSYRLPRRSNLGFEARVVTDASSWLKLSAAAQIQKASLNETVDNGTAIPGIPGTILNLAASTSLARRWNAHAGIKHVGERSLSPDGFFKGRPIWLADVGVGYQGPGWGFNVGAENLLNTAWNEMEMVAVTKLPGETACPAGTKTVTENGSFAGCQDTLVRPGLPFRLTARLYSYF